MFKKGRKNRKRKIVLGSKRKFYDFDGINEQKGNDIEHIFSLFNLMPKDKDMAIKKEKLSGLSATSKDALVNLLYFDIVSECITELAFEFNRNCKMANSICNICKSK